MAEQRSTGYSVLSILLRLVIAGFALLAALELVYIAIFAFEIYLAGPVQDVWGVVPYLEKNLDQDWFTEELWFSQNGHRLVLLKLQFLLEYHFFDGKNIFLTAVILTCVLAQIVTLKMVIRKNDLDKWIFVIASCILLSPTLLWTIQHNFNLHILQCAVFAFIGIMVFAKGMDDRSQPAILIGLAFAILSNLSAFSLFSVWASIFFVVMTCNGSKKLKPLTFIIFLLFATAYFFLLPESSGNENESGLIQSTIRSLATHDNVSIIFVRDLLVYIPTFLSFTYKPSIPHVVIAALSLAWFIFVVLRIKNLDWIEKACCALMVYAICFALTVGLARGYLGELAYGIRFQPVVLVYWTGFSMSLSMYVIRMVGPIQKFFWLIGLLTYIAVSQWSVTRMLDRQLTEDHIRFSRSQMAYLSGNLSENAVYENLVKEWRKTSYPGIVAGAEFLKQKRLGIYALPVGIYARAHATIPVDITAPCMRISLEQKPRSEDPLIRNIVIRRLDNEEFGHISHIFIYRNGQLNGIAFRAPSPPFRFSMSGQWMGITRVPVDISMDTLQALDTSGSSCRLEAVKIR